MFTQPVMYTKIRSQPIVLNQYAEQLIADNVITQTEFDVSTQHYQLYSVDGQTHTTTLPKLIWERAASPPLPRTIPDRSSRPFTHFRTATPRTRHGYSGAPHISHRKSPPSVDRSPNPTTCLISRPIRLYHPKPHPYPISCFATMHWTDRQTDRHTQTYRCWKECSITYRPLSSYIESAAA